MSAAPPRRKPRLEGFRDPLPRRIATLLLASCTSSLAIFPCEPASCDETGRVPNIILILADDLGYGDLRCYNPRSMIATPNMDRLAAQGVRMTDAHSPSAVCTPTRYGLLTGHYCWRTRLKRGVLLGFSRALVDPDRLTLAKLLKEHGYATACVGKWHLGFDWALREGRKLSDPVGHRDASAIDFTKPAGGGPRDCGFDYFFGCSACPTTDYLYAFIENDRTVAIPSRMLPARRGFRRGEDIFDVAYRPGMATHGWKHEQVDPTFVNKAIAWLQSQAAGEKKRPLFLYLSLSAPHAPWLPPKFVQGKTKEGPRGDMVALVDWAVGEITAALDRLKMSDDTLVVFTSDNGPRIGHNGHQSSGGFRGYKSHIWEGGHRIPLIARWPGRIKPGTTSDEPIELTDVLATTAAVVDAKLPPDAGEDSYNVLPALLGEKRKRPIREAVVSHSVFGVFAVRQGPWKLILDTKTSGGWVRPRGAGPKPGTGGQLYNLADDPGETNNRFAEQPQTVAQLTALLKRYQEQGRSAPLMKSREESPIQR